MSQNLTISETGLKLIKAFEGFRPVDRELITGQRIVGYGHRLYSEDAVMMNKGEAEEVLKTDLEPFEDMINTEVHAPMTQSQFDALCSFAFNIGPKAFLQSDTLRAINNGRPLDAANGLDIWRKSEIDGKTYVVDALMRRRTAEKALFLRTERSVPAGREDLPPIEDTALTGLSTDDELPVFTADDANGIVATAPYVATIAPARRREDGPAGALQLSERDIIEEDETETTGEEGLGLDLDLDLDLDSGLNLEMEETDSSEVIDDALEAADIEDEVELLETIEEIAEETAEPQETEPRKSPIAAAATDIVARLDALIDDADVRFEDEEDWPDSLIDAEDDGLEEAVSADLSADEDISDNIINLNAGSSPLPEGDDEASNLHDSVVEDELSTQEKADLIVEEKLDTQSAQPVAVIDELAQDDAARMRTDSAAKYIDTDAPSYDEVVPEKQSNVGLGMLILLGFILVGLSTGAMAAGSERLIGEWGPIITFTGIVIGIGLILSGVYGALRMNRIR